jgi:adenylate cyclase
VILNAVAYARFADCDFHAALTALDSLENLPGPVPMIELAPALAMRGVIEALLGDTDTGMRRLRECGERVRALPPVNYASVLALRGLLVVLGMCDVDDMVDDMGDAVRRAEEFGDVLGMVAAHFGYGVVGLRSVRVPRGQAVAALGKALGLIESRELSVMMGTAVITDLAREAARTGDVDYAIERLRGLLATKAAGGSRLLAGLPVEALVELLTDRARAGDLEEAHRLVAQWESCQVGIPTVDLWWLRTSALVARADGDGPGFAEAARRYLTCCEELGARGRLADARHLAADAEPTYRS